MSYDAFANAFLWRGLDTIKIEKIFYSLPSSLAFKKAENIYVPGSLGVILCGSAKINRSSGGNKSVVMNSLAASDVFGSASLYSEEDAPHSEIIAQNTCRVSYISEKRLSEIMSEHNVVAYNYIRFLSGRVRFLNNKIDEFTAGSAEQKLFEYLSSRKDERGFVLLEHSISELANRLCLGRSSLYRAIEALENDGYISRDKNEFKIRRK
ncbi:MAG: Crp/Fnr family transcriptional regulator [Oscillospiraceae bacterium]